MSGDDVPWALKGVSTEIRAAARQAAERTGQTVGEWLSQVIRTTEAEERSAQRTPGPAPSPADETPPGTEIARIEQRMAALEQRTETAFAEILRRLDALRPARDEEDGSDHE